MVQIILVSKEECRSTEMDML